MENKLSFEWLRSETKRLGLALDDQDLLAIADTLKQTLKALAENHFSELGTEEPPYRYTPDTAT